FQLEGLLEQLLRLLGRGLSGERVGEPQHQRPHDAGHEPETATHVVTFGTGGISTSFRRSSANRGQGGWRLGVEQDSNPAGGWPGRIGTLPHMPAPTALNNHGDTTASRSARAGTVAASTSSTRSAKTISSSWRTGPGSSRRSVSLARGKSTRRRPARRAASTFSLTPPMGSTRPLS